MRRTSALVVTAVGLAFTLALTSLAHAAPSVDQQAWARTGPVPPTNPQDGNIYVSMAGGQEQARAFLHIDVSGLAASEIAGAHIVLVPASDGIAADQASLIACSLRTALTASGELSQSPPEPDCSSRTDLTRQADGNWSVPLAVFADAWSAGDNRGLAVLPGPSAAPAVFTASFDTKATALDAPAAAAPASTTTTELVSPPDPMTTSATFDVGPLPAVIAPSDAPLAEPTAATATPAASSARRPHDEREGNPAGPSPLLILVPVLLTVGVLWARARRPSRDPSTPVTVSAAVVGKAVAWLVLPLVLMTFAEATIYNVGLVAIAFVAAIGLHLLVNWTGELSLAHAGFIGVPAFAVAQFSSNTGMSPILWLPIAVAVGVALGAIVGVAALRSRGLQVALVTLAFGIAVGQFLFFRTWIVGPPSGLQMPLPSVFGFELQTNRALVPVLAAAVLLAVVAAKSIMGSKIGRALLLVRSDPAAAAAAGIAVAQHRALAYAFAGGFAGLAGWSYVVWVQQVSAKAFPLQLGFTYLVIAALAGSGGLAGVAVAAALIQGGALFSFIPNTVALYLAPIALIFNVTRYQEGFNGALRATRTALESRMGATMATRTMRDGELRLGVVLGAAAVVAGFSAIALAWYHMGNTDAVWVQNQELMSGGVAGLGLIVLGAALLLRDALLARRSDPPQPEEQVVLELPASTFTSTNGRSRRAAKVTAG